MRWFVRQGVKDLFWTPEPGTISVAWNLSSDSRRKLRGMDFHRNGKSWRHPSDSQVSEMPQGRALISAGWPVRWRLE
eukprot:7847946-Karenia_brevis.AAC.1